MSFVLYLSQKSLYKKHHVKSLPNLLKKRGYMADKKQFIDYFGAQVGAAAYAQGRPTYPESFIKSLIDKCLCTYSSTLRDSRPPVEELQRA